MAKNITKYYLWSLPLRACHLGLIASVTVALLTADDDNLLKTHIIAGNVIIFFLTARFIWGFIGAPHERWLRMIPSPKKVMGSILSLPSRSRSLHRGHTALGSLMAFTMLAVIVIVVTSGLFMSDEDGAYAGPFSYFFSYNTLDNISEIHEFFGDFIILLIALHVAAALYYYLWKRDRILISIFSGFHYTPYGVPAPSIVFVSTIRAIFVFCIATLVTYISYSSLWFTI